MRRLLLAALLGPGLSALAARDAAAQCGGGDITFTVAAAGASCTSIQQCVNLVPASLANNYCITIRDTGIYNERVEVKSRSMNGFRIHIGTVTAGPRPTVAAVLTSTFGVFNIEVPSVTVEGINIRAFDDPYGIVATNSGVIVTSVSVTDVSAIKYAGILLSSQSVVANSSVTVLGTYGVVSVGSFNTITMSTIIANAFSSATIHLNGASSNTVSQVYGHNINGGAVVISSGAHNNTISFSTFMASGATRPALLMRDSYSNVVSTTFMRNSGGLTASIQSSSFDNAIRYSTVTTASGPTDASLSFIGSSSNTLAYSYVQNGGGYGMQLFNGADNNTILASTIVVNAAGQGALTITASKSNAVSEAVIQNLTGMGADLGSGAAFNVFDRTIFYSSNTAGRAFNAVNADSNTVTRSFLGSVAGAAVRFSNGADHNVISLSTAASNTGGKNLAALIIENASSSNTFTGGYISNFYGRAVYIATTSYNSIALSTVVGGGGSNYLPTVYVHNSGSVTIVDSYVQSLSTLAVHFELSDDNFIQNSIIFGGSFNGALYLDESSSNTVTGTDIMNPNGDAVQVFFNANSNVFDGCSLLSDQSASGSIFIISSSETLIVDSYLENPSGYGAWLFSNADNTRIIASTMLVNSGSYYALEVDGSNGLSMSGSYMQNYAALAARFEFDAHHNVVDLSTAVGASDGIFFAGSSSNTVSRSLIRGIGAYGISLGSNASDNTVVRSTVSGGSYGVYFTAGSSNTITESFVSGFTSAIHMFSDARSNTISYSTITNNNAGSAAIHLDGNLNQVHSNAFAYDYVQNSNGEAVRLQGDARMNTFSESYLVGLGGGVAMVLTDADDNLLTDSFVLAPNAGGYVVNAGSTRNAIVRSSITASYAPGATQAGVRIIGSSATWILDSYVHGSSGVVVQASSYTVIGGSMLVSTGTGASALNVAASVDLDLTTSVVRGVAGNGVSVIFPMGSVRLTTNTIGGLYSGVVIGTAAPSTQIWLSSNTILPQAVTGAQTKGLMLDGLPSGAIIQNNSIYYRSVGAPTGGGGSASAFEAHAVQNMTFERNRINNPGVLNGASGNNYVAIHLRGVTFSSIRYNDVNSSATFNGTGSLYNLRLSEFSGNLNIRNNVFASNFSVGASTLMVLVESGSNGGNTINYNAYFSSGGNQPVFEYTTNRVQGLGAWQGASSYDGNSLVAHPLWPDTRPGFEEFHPRSTAGRYNPATGTHNITDASTSQTIDRGDPADGSGSEPFPHGSRANQGSYGRTSEASMTGQPFAGCALVHNVGAGQSFASIQGAVNALPTTLTGHSCIIVEDAVNFFEQVVISGIQNNGSSITIRSRFDTPLRPTVRTPGAGIAPFVIQNASVNIIGIDVTADNTNQYGIFASSGWVTISSVNVTVGGGGAISLAGISLSSWSTVAYASVTVNNTIALHMDSGAQRSQILNSTFSNNAGGAATIFLNGSSSNTFTGVRAHNLNGFTMLLGGSSRFNVIAQSTITTDGPSGIEALFFNGADSNTVTGSYMHSLNGFAARLNPGSDYNVISLSTMIGGGNIALSIDNSAYNTVTDARVFNPSQHAVVVDNGSHHNVITRSTFAAQIAAGKALFLVGATSNTISFVTAENTAGGAVALNTNSNYNQISFSSFNSTTESALGLTASTANVITGLYAVSSSSHALMMISGSHRNTVSGGTFTANNMFSNGVHAADSSSNTFTALRAMNPTGTAFMLGQGADYNVIAQSTMIASGRALYLTGNASTTLTGLYLYSPNGNALRVENARRAAVERSTVAGGVAAIPALFVIQSASVSVTDSLVTACPGPCVGYSFSSYNSITRSTISRENVASEPALDVNNSSWNALTDVYVSNIGGTGARFMMGASFNSILNSTFSNVAGSAASLDFDGASSNTVVQTRIQAAGNALQFTNNSHWNTVSYSTMVAGTGLPLAITFSTGTLVMNSYVEGSSSVYVGNNSFVTTVLLNRVAAGTGCGVLTTNSGNLAVTSNTISSSGDGVCLDGGVSVTGRLDVASNTVVTRGWGARVGNQAADVKVWVSSNVFLPVPGAAVAGGISVDGLSTGGTFYNNSVYYRATGGLGGVTHVGMRFYNAANITASRNRINMPDRLTSGSFNAVELANVNIDFSRNDVHVVSLGGLNSINLLFSSGGGGTPVIRNNIFSSSITASSTFTLNMSGGGFSSNYNVYHSSNGQPYFNMGATPRAGLAAWSALTGGDASSVSGHPYWANTEPGAEDFHVKSTLGRCTDAPACTSFQNDMVDSASLDAADPALPYDAESLPNGFHANAGSTGGTNEASRSPTGVCAVTRKVCKTGGCQFSSIQAAVNSIPNPLVGHSCVFIRDTAIYDESVVVASFTLAGSSITIAVDPAFSTGAVLRPNVGGPAAILDIRVASTTVSGLEVRTFAAMNYPYGVRVTSANVTLSSVTVDDGLAQLTVAGIKLDNASTVINASVSVAGANTYAILSSGTAWTRLTSVQMSGNGGGVNPLFYMYAAASASLIDIRALSTGSREAAHFHGASNFTVDRATFSTGTGATALRLSTVTSASFTGVVLLNTGGDKGLWTDAQTSGVLIDRSSISASPSVAFSGMELRGSSITISNARITMSDSGYGVDLMGQDITLSSVSLYAPNGGVFVSASTRVVISNSDIRTGNLHGVRFNDTAGHTVIDSTMATNAFAAASALHLQNASSNTAARVFLYNTGSSGYALGLNSSSSNTFTDVFASVNSGIAGVYYSLSSSNVIRSLRSTNYAGNGVGFDSFSSGNVIDVATITGMGFSASGIYYNNASSNIVSNAVVVSTSYYGVYLSMTSNWNSISRSTATASLTDHAGLYASNASSNTFADSYFSAPAGRGIQLTPGSHNNRILRSTMVAGNNNRAGIEFNQVNDTYVDQSVILSTNGYIAAWITAGSLRTYIERSSLRGSGGSFARAYQVDSGNFNVVERSVLNSSGDGALLQSANNRISASTVTGAAYGIYVSGTSQEVSENEVWGATAVYVNNAPDARIVSNRLTGTSAEGAGAYYAMTTNIFFASNTVTGPSGGKGLGLASDNGGLIRIATNTFRPGPTYGFMTGALLTGTTLYISSNTFLPTVSGSTSTYGLYFNGLSQGATVQNNSIYYRATGAMAAGMITYGLYAQNSPSLVVDHNRYNNPDVLTSGGAAGFAFFASGGVRFTYNDVYSGEINNTAAYLLNLDNSPNAFVSGNIFSSSMTAAQSIVINVADVASQTGFNSDYNDIHLNGSNARAGRWGGGGTLTFPGWQSTTSRDLNSISAHPVWVSTTAGNEDFHPRSAALNGRFDQAAGFGFVTDGVSSPTIDKGNPADPVGAETAPGDSRANQGSYAQTAEASKAAPPPGCTIERTVPDVEFTIQDAITNLGGSLAADTCIVVREAYHYASDVSIGGIATNGFRLTIMGEPGVPTTMDTNGGSFAFNIDNPSVTIKDLKIQPTLAIINAIRATGSDVHITSLSMVGPGLITGLGVSISSRSIISYSSITVGGRAIELSGIGASVLYSTAVTINPVHNALNINGASSVTITNLYATAPSTVAVLGGGARGAFITGSTFTTNGFVAFHVSAASSNVISGSVMNAPFGTALRFDAGAYDNTVIFSTMTNIANGVPAVLFSGVSSNTVARSVVDSAGIAATIELRSGARLNTIAQMTLLGHSGEPVIEAVGASSNTFTQLIIANAFGYGVRLQAGSHYNSVALSTVNVDAAVFAVPVFVVASSGTRILDSYIARGGPIGGGQAVYFSNGSNYGSVEGSTLTSNNSYAFLIDSSSRTVFARSMAVHTNGVPSLYINSGYASRVERSTVVASGNDGVYAFLSADTEVFGSYVQGDRAVVIDNSARARVDSNRLNAPSGLGRGVQVQGGSIGFSMSSNTITGSGAGAGVYIDQNNGGVIIIATNSISTGDRRARYGIFIGTQNVGAKVFIASNTIVPATVVAASLGPTYGIYLDGLRTGATIQNNNIYYRSPGSMVGSYSIGIHARASDRIVIDHNRINNPGMVTAGSAAALFLEEAPNTDFRFNDVNVMSADGSPLEEGYALFIQLSTGVRIMNNVVSASMTATITSATFKVDNQSTVGSLPDFNIYFSSNNRNTLLQQYPSSSVAQEFPWGGNIDQNSLSVNPHWPSVLPGSEDFHPRSQFGRFDQVAGFGFINDAWTSGSLDRGDYTLPVGLEPAGENGNKINMGSYGGTAEASKTPPAPTAPAVVAVYASSITVSFTPGGATGHTVAVSSVPNFAAVIVSSQSDNGTVTLLTPNAPALEANTTYFIIVAANWGDAFIQSATDLSTPTLAYMPGLPAGVAFPLVHHTSAAAAWSTGGNPVGVTTYTVTLSTGLLPNSYSGNVTVTSLTYTLAPEALVQTLVPNTTYFAHVAALNHAGAVTAYRLVGSSATRANTPAALALPLTFASVTDQSLSVSWDANGNPLGITSYTVVASTASDFNVFADSVVAVMAPTAGPLSPVTGLDPATTYYFQVNAINGDGERTAFVGLGSTVTLPLQIFPPVTQPVTSVTTYSVTAAWALTNNATGYTLVASTMNVNPPLDIVASSQTFGQSATSATVSAPSLTPNTTYFLFVRAHGFTANSLYAAFPATATLAALPLTAVTTFTAVESTSFTVSWLSGGNPLGMTTYTVVASTASDFNAGASSVTLSTVPAGGPTATLTGLGAYADWYVQVRALGQGAQVTPYVSLGSTRTLPIFLAAPAAGATGVSSSSMSATWGLVAGATGYTLVASTMSTYPPVDIIASSGVAGGTTLVGSVFGLTPNATHFLFVRADGPGNSSAYSIFAATATDPVAPLAVPATFTGITNIAASVNWHQNANPVGVTTYSVVLSTTSIFPNTSAGNQSAPVVVPIVTVAAQGLSGLAVNTTYFAFVEAISNAGSRFGTALGSTSTLANAPTLPGTVFTGVGATSVTINWGNGGNPAVTTYTIVASTASDFNAFASSIVYTTAPAVPSATLLGLSFGTTWFFQVRAVNHNGVPTAYQGLGSTYTYLSNLIPQISDFQSGDDVWRSVDNGVYDIRFADASGLNLDRVQISVSTTPGGLGTDLVPFTNTVINLAPLDVYATPFSLPAGAFNAMLEGVTNYVTVRIYNHVPATNTLVDAFYVRKDTTAPLFTNAEAGGDAVVQIAPGRLYNLTARDTASGLDVFQYSASLTPGGDATLIGWTDIAPLSGATDYTTPWAVNFAALQSNVTNYISVRAVDMAGSTTTLNDAFKVFKDTVGPSVSISTPNVGSGFVSAVFSAGGNAAGPFGLAGAEVSVKLNPGLYWDGVSAFTSGAPVWMPATGASTWTATLGITFANGTAYQIIARSSTTYGMYSTIYATASFTLDTSTPTVGVVAPVPLSTVASLPVLSGTAADTGSGVDTIEVRFRRLSDGQYWNWFTDAWQPVPVSSVSAGPAVWSVTPSATLQANLLSGASYYVAVRASDASLPANAGDFFGVGSATFTFNDPTPPNPIGNLAAVNGPLPGDIYLTWTAQGAHGAAGITSLGQYAIFGSTNMLDAPSTSAAQVLFATSSVIPGAFQGYVEGGLSAGVTYFIRVAMANADGNWSAFSNQASTTATPAPSNSILGHVVNASTQGITAVRIDAFNTSGVLVATAFTLADGSGTYSVNGLTTGDYKIEASWTANGITTSVSIDGVAMGSVNVDFSLDINYALATLTGTLGALTASGYSGLGVAGSGYRPSAEGSRVELYQSGREVARVASDPTGRWTIGHLLPGTYSVRAYTGAGYTEFVDVNLAEGEIHTVSFLVNPLPEAAVYAFPNPARHSTTIRFETALLPLEAQIAIFDLKGSLVREIPGSQITSPSAGRYHYVWDLTNSRGQAVASGVYLFMVKVKGGTDNQLVKVVKKLAVVR